jgi:hypothetical protein
VNTPAHLIIGLAVFGRSPDPKVVIAALAGALLPDLSLYLLAGWALFVTGIAPQVVFGEMYFSARWQSVFAVDNSIPLWAFGFGLALLAGSGPAKAFAGAGLLHLLCDFPLHNDDARAHFWPFTDWVFHSPVSYWDPAHYGRVVGVLEILLALGLAALLWRYFKSLQARALIGLLVLVEAAPPLVFGLIMGGAPH